VYVALLRTCQNEYKDLVQVSLDTLVPALPKRLRYDDFVKAMKWTKKVVFEEGHTLPQLIHVWNIIVRHASIFYPFRSHFIPQMVSSISRLGIPPNCPTEHRQVALGCVEALIGWEYIRLKKLELREQLSAESSLVGAVSMNSQNEKEEEFSLHPSMIQMIGNFLVRLGLFTADNKDPLLSKLSDKCVLIYQTLVNTVVMTNIKITYFERLFKTFLDNAAKNRAGTSSVSNNNGKDNSIGKSDEENSLKGRNPNPLLSSKRANDNSVGEISERMFLILIQFLSVSLENKDLTANLVYDNIGLLKEMLGPLVQTDHLSKPLLSAQFRKLIVKIFSKYPPSSALPAFFLESGFYQQLAVLLENLFRADYGEISSPSRRSSELKGTQSRKSRGDSIIGVPWNHLWSLQLIDDICVSTKFGSWVENIGGGLVSLCRQFLRKHISASQVIPLLSFLSLQCITPPSLDLKGF
jgi:hypothetical protein